LTSRSAHEQLHDHRWYPARRRQHSQRPRLLDFWQASCAPCRPLEPRLERVAEARPGQFIGYRIDVDTDTVNRYGVMSIPTIVPLRDGHEVARLDGLIREQDIEETLLARAAD